MTEQALEGLKVADFTWVITGPLITKALGDHGATVVRIESELRPDVMRTSSPYAGGKAGLNRSGFFSDYNTSKLSMALNLTTPKGIEVAKRLVGWSDIVVENFAPGVMERLGLGYDALTLIKPDIIMLRTSMQGQTGPHARHPGFGTMLADLAGFGYLMGWPDRSPVTPYGAYTDFTAPPLGLAALMAALIYRNKTGKGQCIDLSQLECASQFLAPAILDYEANGHVACRQGNRSPSAAPHGVYRCKGEDRWCAIAVLSDEQWESFCRVLEHEEWVKDERFRTLLGRIANQDELDTLVEQWTRELPAGEVMQRLQAAGIPSGAVLDTQGIHEDPQLAGHRRHFRYLQHREMGSHSYSTSGFRLSATPGNMQGPAPCLGEHTEYVCIHLLGMSDTEFLDLLNEGIFR